MSHTSLTEGGYVYFRCRYPEEYALANKVKHPRNIFVREHQVTALVDPWLAKVLAPHRIKQTIADIHGAQEPPTNTAAIRAKAQVADCETKLARHRAALEAGANPVTIAQWMDETEAHLAAARAELRSDEAQRPRILTTQQIDELITALGDLVRVLKDASPEARQVVSSTRRSVSGSSTTRTNKKSGSRLTSTRIAS